MKKIANIVLVLSIVLSAILGVYFYRESEKKEDIPKIPEFSVESGMYENDFELALTAEKGTKIYYTLDGSEPDTASTEYTGPIHITNVSNQKNRLSDMGTDLITGKKGYTVPVMNVDKGTVVRAVSINAENKSSRAVTKTYFVGINSARYQNLPIISIVTNPYNLFDYEAGIYVLGRTFDDFMYENPNKQFDGSVPANYNQRGIKWERTAHIEYFDAGGIRQVSQDIGIRTQGAYSRANIQKSFALYAREEYGKATMDYDFFGEGKDVSFEKLILQSIEETKYVDPYISMAAKDLDFDTVNYYQPVVVFLDGEYWGVYTLRKSVSVEYIAEKYDLDVDDVLLVKADGYGEYKIESGRARDIGYFQKMTKFAATHDMTLDENYEKICEMMDMQSFVDWIATEIYLGNNDCIKPGRFDNNVKVWRVMVPDQSNPYADGKWRWILYDTDKAAAFQNNYAHDDLQKRLLEENDLSEMQKLFRNLIVNEEFRSNFSNTFISLGTSVFNQAVQTEKWDEFVLPYSSQLERFFARFPSEEPALYASTKRVHQISEFFHNRPLYVTGMIDNMNQYFAN